MLELEKKHVKAYLKDKKDIDNYNKQLNIRETEFYKVFSFITNEYYYNIKKEFADSEIIERCNITEIIWNEIKSFLTNKKLIEIKNDKIIINYETVVFLDEMINNYKNHYMMGTINILTFFLAVLSLIVSIFDLFILKVVAVLGVIYYIHLLSTITKKKIGRTSNYK